MSIADRLKQVRASLGLNQLEMSERLCVKGRAYQNYESGERLPQAESLQAISALGFNINWLLTGTGREFLLPCDIRVQIKRIEDSWWPVDPTNPEQVQQATENKQQTQETLALLRTVLEKSEAAFRSEQGAWGAVVDTSTVDPTCGSGGFLVQAFATLDAELNARVVEAVSAAYADTGAKISPRDLGRVSAEIYNDITAAGLDEWDDKMVALRVTIGALRRRLTTPAEPNPGSAQGKRLA